MPRFMAYFVLVTVSDHPNSKEALFGQRVRIFFSAGFAFSRRICFKTLHGRCRPAYVPHGGWRCAVQSWRRMQPASDGLEHHHMASIRMLRNLSRNKMHKSTEYSGLGKKKEYLAGGMYPPAQGDGNGGNTQTHICTYIYIRDVSLQTENRIQCP